MTLCHAKKTLTLSAAVLGLACGGEGSVHRDDRPGVVGPNSVRDEPSPMDWQPAPADSGTPVEVHGSLRVEGPNLVDETGASGAGRL
jgi:hypothetical protein